MSHLKKKNNIVISMANCFVCVCEEMLGKLQKKSCISKLFIERLFTKSSTKPFI